MRFPPGEDVVTARPTNLERINESCDGRRVEKDMVAIRVNAKSVATKHKRQKRILSYSSMCYKFMIALMSIFMYMLCQSHSIRSELATNAHDLPKKIHIEPSYPKSSLLRQGKDKGCQYIRKRIQSHQHNHMHAFKMNQLRRELMLKDDDDTRQCFEEHLDFFADEFESRINRKHVMLHIPKAGGTSVCQTIREEGLLRIEGDNCWKDDFCPLWIGCTEPKSTSCDAIDSWKVDFVMNENWFDGFCHGDDNDERRDHSPTYSILLREPLHRTMSHLNYFLHAIDYRHDHFFNTKVWRLSLIQSNYMTWALSAGAWFTKGGEREEQKVEKLESIKPQHPKQFKPSQEDLDIAMNNLLGMDYIVDLHHSNQPCINRIMKIMRVQGDVTNENVHYNSAKHEYASDFHVSDIAALNALDVPLFEFATRLIDVDCQFLERLKQRHEGEVIVM